MDNIFTTNFIKSMSSPEIPVFTGMAPEKIHKGHRYLASIRKLLHGIVRDTQCSRPLGMIKRILGFGFKLSLFDNDCNWRKFLRQQLLTNGYILRCFQGASEHLRTKCFDKIQMSFGIGSLYQHRWASSECCFVDDYGPNANIISHTSDVPVIKKNGRYSSKYFPVLNMLDIGKVEYLKVVKIHVGVYDAIKTMFDFPEVINVREGRAGTLQNEVTIYLLYDIQGLGIHHPFGLVANFINKREFNGRGNNDELFDVCTGRTFIARLSKFDLNIDTEKACISYDYEFKIIVDYAVDLGRVWIKEHGIELGLECPGTYNHFECKGPFDYCGDSTKYVGSHFDESRMRGECGVCSHMREDWVPGLPGPITCIQRSCRCISRGMIEYDWGDSYMSDETYEDFEEEIESDEKRAILRKKTRNWIFKGYCDAIPAMGKFPAVKEGYYWEMEPATVTIKFDRYEAKYERYRNIGRQLAKVFCVHIFGSFNWNRDIFTNMPSIFPSRTPSVPTLPAVNEIRDRNQKELFDFEKKKSQIKDLFFSSLVQYSKSIADRRLLLFNEKVKDGTIGKREFRFTLVAGLRPNAFRANRTNYVWRYCNDWRTFYETSLKPMFLSENDALGKQEVKVSTPDDIE